MFGGAGINCLITPITNPFWKLLFLPIVVQIRPKCWEYWVFPLKPHKFVDQKRNCPKFKIQMDIFKIPSFNAHSSLSNRFHFREKWRMLMQFHEWFSEILNVKFLALCGDINENSMSKIWWDLSKNSGDGHFKIDSK